MSDAAYQNDEDEGAHQIVHHTVDIELENDLEHPEHILEEVDMEEITNEGANATIHEDEFEYDDEDEDEYEDEDEDEDEDETEDEDVDEDEED